MEHPIREARLRPEFAELYPGVQPDVWMPATTLGQQLLLWHLTVPTTAHGDRLFEDEHFEFRGGSKRSGPWVDTRARLPKRQ